MRRRKGGKRLSPNDSSMRDEWVGGNLQAWPRSNLKEGWTEQLFCSQSSRSSAHTKNTSLAG